MEKGNYLHIGEKIRRIRKLKGLSQANLAYDLGCSQVTISRIEQNRMECSNIMLDAIKQALDIADAPLIPSEVIIFRKRLQMWHNLIRAARLEDAKKMHQDFGLGVILFLPFEEDLTILYKMFEAQSLFAEGSHSKAEEALAITPAIYSRLNDENLFYFHYNQGLLCIHHQDYQQGLFNFLKAYELNNSMHKPPSENNSLYVYISSCYSNLGMPHHSIAYAERVDKELCNSDAGALQLNPCNILAANYINTGQLERAQKLLDKCLMQAKSTNNKHHIGLTLHNYGRLYMQSNMPKSALEYFGMASAYSEKNNGLHIENLYYNIRCLIELKDYRKSKLALHEAKSLLWTNGSHQILFKSLSCLMSLGDGSSYQYIKDVAIPHLVKSHSYFKAIDYCKILESTLPHNHKTKKASQIAATTRDIYERIIFGIEPIIKA